MKINDVISPVTDRYEINVLTNASRRYETKHHNLGVNNQIRTKRYYRTLYTDGAPGLGTVSGYFINFRIDALYELYQPITKRRITIRQSMYTYLLNKSSSYSILPPVCSWIISFLSNRFITVDSAIEGDNSALVFKDIFELINEIMT